MVAVLATLCSRPWHFCILMVSILGFKLQRYCSGSLGSCCLSYRLAIGSNPNYMVHFANAPFPWRNFLVRSLSSSSLVLVKPKVCFELPLPRKKDGLAPPSPCKITANLFSSSACCTYWLFYRYLDISKGSITLIRIY